MPSILFQIITKLKCPMTYSTFKRIILKIPTCLIIFICTLATLSLNGCSSKENKTEYKTIKAARQTFSLAVTALGTVKPQVGAEVRLGARIPGKVEHLYANVGDYVEKGQIIAEIEKDELKAAVQKQQAELSLAKINLATRRSLGPIEIMKAEADLSQFKAIYELKTTEFESETMLFNGNFTTRQSFDQVREALLVAKAALEASSKTLELTRNQLNEDLKSLDAEVESTAAALRIAEITLSYASLHAPIAGIIGSVSTQEGETVAVGLSAPTFVTIIDLDRLQVETYVDEVDIGKIKIGQKATFMVEAFPSIDIEGEVVGIYPKAVLKENVVFYNVMVKSLKPSPVELRPEMTANVSISLETRKDVLVIAASSVKKSGGVNFVYLMEKGKPVRREVKIGWKQGRFLEITEGLKAGDEVLEDQGDFKGEEL
jgi:multidrug efflux pump subunit AcrA (membrane-fusion protein)